MGYTNLRITHFKYDTHRWYLRFTGPTEDFTHMRQWLNAQPYYFASWQPRYEWPDGKTGAWACHGGLLVQITYCFTNLHGHMSSSVETTSFVYDCHLRIDGQQETHHRYLMAAIVPTFRFDL